MSRAMTLEEKLAILIAHAADDADGQGGPSTSATTVPPRLRQAGAAGALGPLNLRQVRIGGDGRRATLLRVLLTNACSLNCHYCPMRRDRDLPRTVLKPEELVRIFLVALARGWCTGLFVTTGIPGRASRTLDDLITVLELLRLRHRYAGYIHVKLIAGGEGDQVARVTELATRVSVNIEAPCGASLTTIAPDKRFADTLVTLERARTEVGRGHAERAGGVPNDPLRPRGRAGITMQFVVGADASTDREVLGTVNRLTSPGGVHHAHFSAFRPIVGTPMEGRPATPPIREHRLYQADWLVRRYGFGAGEIVFDAAGALPLTVDPKTAWALAHRERFPVDLMRAPMDVLLRVPGVGPLAARRIVEHRRATTILTASHLRALGVVTTRAAGFLMLHGRQLSTIRYSEQLSLWAPESDAGVPRKTFAVSPGTFR